MVWVRANGIVEEALQRAGALAQADGREFDAHMELGFVQHQVLYDACELLTHHGELGYSFERVLADNPKRLVLTLPEVLAPRPAELDRRLQSIEKKVQNMRYAEMIKDVAPSYAAKLQMGETASASSFVASLRNQTSMAGNVVATMLTCFATGYFLARTYFGESHPSAALVGGAIGLTVGLFFDIIIVMARIHAIEKAAAKAQNQDKAKR